MNPDIAKAVLSQIQAELEELTFKDFILLINHYKQAPAPISMYDSH